MTSSTFTSNPAPEPDRFRDGDIWLSPAGRLFAVYGMQGIASHLCMLRPCGHSCQSRIARRTNINSWTRTSWGGQP